MLLITTYLAPLHNPEMATILTSNSIDFFSAVFVLNIYMKPHCIYSVVSDFISSALFGKFLHTVRYSYRSPILIAV